MTPQEKAKELINKFGVELNWLEIDYNVSLYRDVKQCALIVVNEMIEQCKDSNFGGFSLYWEEVKKELESF